MRDIARSTKLRGASARIPSLRDAACAALLLLPFSGSASAAADVAAWMLFDARTGEVLARENAFQPWAPASVTKLMTTYVTLKAMRSGRVRPTSPVVVSALANTQPPSNMGFPTGTVLTIDNALKIIMVKSANDIAWALGEAVGGSQAGFVEEMNATAARLGMATTHFVNSNGLPAEGQVTNAHDLGLLARALLVEFPEYEGLYNISALQFGKHRIPNHNDLLARFPGADGMKTGFICASGYNVVASATRDGRRLIAVVLGARSGKVRAEKAGELFTKGFSGTSMLGWFARSENIHAMTVGQEISNPPGNMREIVCGKGHSEEEESTVAEGSSPQDLQKVSYLSPRMPPAPPVKIWLGGAEMPAGQQGQSQVAAAPVPAKPGAAPVFVRAAGSLVPQAAPANPIDQSFDLLKAQQAAKAGAQADPQSAKLSPIIEDLPDPPARPKKVKKAKAARQTVVLKPKS